MSVPTFNGTALCSRAAREQIGSVEVRVQFESLPGVRGQFVLAHGTGGRDIRVEGILEATGVSAGAAHAALKTSLRSVQALADGATVGTYVGTDGAAYGQCMLLSLSPAGAVLTSAEGASTYRALLPIAAVVRQLEP